MLSVNSYYSNIAYRNKTYQAIGNIVPTYSTDTRPGSCMYAAMSESWPGSGIVVSYKKQGFEECLGNVMTVNSLLIIWLERGTRIHILESRNRRANGVDMLFAHIDMEIALASESTL